MRLDVYFVLLSGKTVLNECQAPEDPLRVCKIKKQNVVISNYTVVISTSTVYTTRQSSHSIPVVA